MTVRLDRISTKTGDDGTTGLADGTRLSKSSPRIEAIGAIDELNACLGLVLSSLLAADRDQEQTENGIVGAVRRIQNDLFDIGADLAFPIENDAQLDYESLRLSSVQIIWLERRIEESRDKSPPLKSFVLPGGSVVSSWLHLARTIARRAERSLVELKIQAQLNPQVLVYINRLSDYLFVVSREANDCGLQDILWQAGRYRDEQG